MSTNPQENWYHCTVCDFWHRTGDVCPGPDAMHAAFVMPTLPDVAARVTAESAAAEYNLTATRAMIDATFDEINILRLKIARLENDEK